MRAVLPTSPFFRMLLLDE
jgi:hypothetical protein